MGVPVEVITTEGVISDRAAVEVAVETSAEVAGSVVVSEQQKCVSAIVECFDYDVYARLNAY